MGLRSWLESTAAATGGQRSRSTRERGRYWGSQAEVVDAQDEVTLERDGERGLQ